MTVEPLSVEALYRQCNPDQFSFATTADLRATIEIIGQDRAIEAVRFGIGIEQEGYNLFALGPSGIGKHTTVLKYLEEKAAQEPIPPDWCYVHNFSQPHQPKALRLPAGRGTTLAQDMQQMVDELFTVIPASFESEEYQVQAQAIAEELQGRQEEALEALSKRAQERNIALVRTQAGLAFAPMRQGEVIAPDEFMKLPEEEREQVQAEVVELQGELQKILRQIPQWSREGREKLKELNREVATFTLTPVVEEVRQKYNDLPHVLEYLQDVQQDITENVDKFLQSPAQSSSMARLMGHSASGAADDWADHRSSPASPFFNRYKVNVLVDHSHSQGAPVIYEDHPTYQNLIGRIEHIAQMGALLTDFSLIKPGALHQANGGYLILEARNVLAQPYAWEGMKRALQANNISVESLGQMLSLITTVSLEPEAIPLDVKIVLLGERLLYYLLYQFDPEFRELFKVNADFEDQLARTPENNQAYAQFIATLTHKNELRPFDRTAVARVIEHSSRLISDAEKLSAHLENIADLLRESDYWAGEAGDQVVTATHVQQAIDAKVYRSSRLRERMQEAIWREIVLIDTSGEKVGQINGLSVLQVGDFTFGRPSRITARVQMGKGEVVDIERRVELGGPIHSKGVLILAGFLGGRYAAERPLSLSASLVFEQSYAGVEGDSASSAALYALLSALADIPIRQSFAVTGSVSQYGQIQAIGGVNDKIEGFFDLCRQRGLTGEQGVLIPASNVQNLMLRQDVVAAVAEGHFHVYPVTSVDEGIELLTGVPAGERDEAGNYPEGTINQRVTARLLALAERQRDFNRPAPDRDEKGVKE